MTRFVGLDISQKMTAICVVEDTGRRLWRGQCTSDPAQVEHMIRARAGDNAHVGLETGPMTPWLVHELRDRGLQVTCLDARHARAALKMQINKTDQNDAEGLAQIMRTGWYRSVHVKSLESHRARALLGARAQLVGMTTRLSNNIRGILKTFGLLPGECAVFHLIGGWRLCSPIATTWHRSFGPCSRHGDSYACRLPHLTKRSAH